MENQLCKRFGVSRTPIRSVLQRLEQNRFVQIIPCKGTIVTAIDTGVVDQLIFQRVAVEGMVFRDFVQSCSPMEILAVEHLYNMLLEAAAGRSDPENFDFNHFLSCDLAMHEYWFHKTSKEYLWEQMTRPQADYSRFIRLDIVGARNVSSVVSEHAEMLRILREKDLDAIEPLMRTHLYGGRNRSRCRKSTPRCTSEPLPAEIPSLQSGTSLPFSSIPAISKHSMSSPPHSMVSTRRPRTFGSR